MLIMLVLFQNVIFFYNIAFSPECLINKIDIFDIERTFDMDIHLISHDQLLYIIYFIKGIQLLKRAALSMKSIYLKRCR